MFGNLCYKWSEMKVIPTHLDTLQKIAEALPPVGGARVAAMLTKGHKVVAIGYNQNKSHPFQAKFAKNKDAIDLHAETDCIQNALHSVSTRDLRKMTLYIVRVKRPGAQSQEWIWGDACPCVGCSRMIATFGIRNVVFSTDEHKKWKTL